MTETIDEFSGVTRSGVILRTKREDGQYVYLFGVDNPSKDLTDWGGHVDRNDLNIFHTASRELYEESLGCAKLTPEEIAKGKLLNNGNILISIVEIDKKSLIDIIVCFNRTYTAIKNEKMQRIEVCGTTLINSEEIGQCIQKGKIYSKVTKVLENNIIML